jgi:hypothetical protein
LGGGVSRCRCGFFDVGDLVAAGGKFFGEGGDASVRGGELGRKGRMLGDGGLFGGGKFFREGVFLGVDGSEASFGAGGGFAKVSNQRFGGSADCGARVRQLCKLRGEFIRFRGGRGEFIGELRFVARESSGLRLGGGELCLGGGELSAQRGELGGRFFCGGESVGLGEELVCELSFFRNELGLAGGEFVCGFLGSGEARGEVCLFRGERGDLRFELGDLVAECGNTVTGGGAGGDFLAGGGELGLRGGELVFRSCELRAEGCEFGGGRGGGFLGGGEFFAETRFFRGEGGELGLESGEFGG